MMSERPRILQDCHCAMPSGGKLLIVDAVIPPGNAAHFGKLLDLEMPVMTQRGRERTRAEFQTLLKRSGFRLRRVVPDCEPSLPGRGREGVSGGRTGSPGRTLQGGRSRDSLDLEVV
jgi:hypothetical protein